MSDKLVKVSKNLYRGSQILSIDEVVNCYNNGLSIYNIAMNKVLPAAIYAHWQAIKLRNAIYRGYLYRTFKKNE